MINSGKNKTVHVLFFSLFCFLAILVSSDCVFAVEESSLLEVVSDTQADEYLIGPEDLLEIAVWKNPDLSKTVIVLPDGMISLPLIGDVRAAGLTPYQLKMVITEKLKKYQQTAVVSVIVQELNSYKIFVIGEVNSPGTYPLKSRITIIQAIALAGGFTQFASKNKIVIVRGNMGSNDEDEKIKVKFKDIVNVEKSANYNFVLRSGDTIFVP